MLYAIIGVAAAAAIVIMIMVRRWRLRQREQWISEYTAELQQQIEEIRPRLVEEDKAGKITFATELLKQDNNGDTGFSHLERRVRVPSLDTETQRKLISLLNEARLLAGNLKDYYRDHEWFARQYEEFRRADSATTALELFEQLRRSVNGRGKYTCDRLAQDFGADVNDPGLRDQLVLATYNDLLASIASEDDVYRLHDLITKWCKNGVMAISHPENWLKLVVEHVAAPKLKLFPDEEALGWDGNLRLRAVHALSLEVDHPDDALREGKIVLAIADEYPPNREALGGLTVELAKMIRRLQPHHKIPWC